MTYNTQYYIIVDSQTNTIHYQIYERFKHTGTY